MKSTALCLALTALVLVMGPAAVAAQDSAHEAAMGVLKQYLTDPAALDAYATSNPDQLKAIQGFTALPPKIQQRIMKVVLMLLEERGGDTTKYLDAESASGPEATFRAFPPDVQREIEDIASELAKDPEFMKRMPSLR
ncbi:MAG: hypothetical protein PHY31_01305 [Smithellaceae bacterium]|nr:hypothetical protein [Smithellaceae bacterium]